jgi:hypothetical protein
LTGTPSSDTAPRLDDLFGAVPPVVAELRDVATVRRRCAQVLAAVRAGESEHFRLDERRAGDVADRIAAVTRTRFPDLTVPYHSRWRHFEAGGVDRTARLDAAFADRGRTERARAHIELALVSVLLDAGAGPDWRYREAGTGLTLARSEGLGVASFHAFLAGTFSSDPRDPYRVDARALAGLDAARLADVFQVAGGNPLVGLEGRAELLRRLAGVLRTHPQVFGPDGRPGLLFDALTARQETVAASALLRAMLDAFSAIWPSGQAIDVAGERWPLGDVWRHPAADAGVLPFHKLSQWLTYSLVEPFEWAGVRVTGLDDPSAGLTGLPEYRNGGLLLDAGLLVPRTADWALTVALLDELAPQVRDRLAAGASDLVASRARALPLACLLEGGSWAAGRAIAAELRPGGPPPVTVVSDGTVF